jgi:uncharacterized glyoxalase superfamily protein PhnB
MTARAYPCLSYTDADAAIRWMHDALGFTEKEVYRDDAGAVAHAEVVLGDALIMLGADRDDGGPGFSSPKGGRPTAGIYLGVDDADAAHARAVAAGVELVRELQDTTYGSREFGVRDPEGNLWFVGTYRP